MDSPCYNHKYENLIKKYREWSSAMETVKLGMLGLGTVGSGVLEMIENNENKIRNIIGRELSVKTVVVRHPEKHQNAATIT